MNDFRRRWSSRLAFPLLILSAAALLHGLKLRHDGTTVRGNLYLTAAVVAGAAGAGAMSVRHR